MGDPVEGWVEFCPLEELRTKGRVVRWAGEIREACALWLDGAPRVFSGVCPHAGGPLGEGRLAREGGEPVIRCPWHGYAYDLSTGACGQAGILKLAFLPFKVEGGVLYVRA